MAAVGRVRGTRQVGGATGASCMLPARHLKCCYCSADVRHAACCLQYPPSPAACWARLVSGQLLARFAAPAATCRLLHQLMPASRLHLPAAPATSCCTSRHLLPATPAVATCLLHLLLAAPSASCCLLCQLSAAACCTSHLMLLAAADGLTFGGRFRMSRHTRP